MAAVALGGLALPLLEACGSERSAAAVCRVWDSDGRALHDQMDGIDASKDLAGALASVATSPSRLGDLMDKMAGVAPNDVEPAFSQLADAFHQTGQNAVDGLNNPGGALISGLALAFKSQGAMTSVNGFLAEHCGIPSG